MILIVVASQLEAQALPQFDNAKIVVSGIGAVAAALATQKNILEFGPSLVLNLGIAGAYVGSVLENSVLKNMSLENKSLEIGDCVLASHSIYAALGAESEAGFLAISKLGFELFKQNNQQQFESFAANSNATELAKRIAVAFGPILTLETVTGSITSAKNILLRYPNALAEAMEGAGAAHAAALHNISFLELRAISNMVGPRDTSKWNVAKALKALATKTDLLMTELKI